MAQQGRRNQRKDPQQPVRYIKQQSTMQELIDEKRIVFNENQESDQVKKSLGGLARETVEKKRQLEVILKKLDEEEEKYPSAKTLFSGKEFTPAEKNDRGVLDDYKTVCNKFSEVIDQCGKVALIHKKGYIKDVTEPEDINFIDGKVTAVQDAIGEKNAIKQSLQLRLRQEIERNKKQDENETGRFSDVKDTNTPAIDTSAIDTPATVTTTTPTNESENTTSSRVGYIQSKEEELREQLTKLDAEIEDLRKYAQEAKMLLTLRNLNVSEEDISDEEKQNIIEFTIEQLVNRGANREELYLEEKVNDEKIFGFLNTGKAQKLINDKIGELTKAESILEEKNERDEEGVKTRNADGFENLRKHVYETIGEGRFRVLITVLPNIIGKEGLFPTKMSVFEVLSGKNAADSLSSAGKMNDDASNAKDLGKVLSKIGKKGKEGDGGFERPTDALEKVIEQCESDKEKLRLQKELEEAKKFDDQEKVMKNFHYNTVDAENVEQLRKASFKAVEEMGKVLEDASDDSGYFAEKALKEEHVTELNSLMVSQRGQQSVDHDGAGRPTNVVQLKDDRIKRMKFSKLMRGISLASRVATKGSRALGGGFGEVADKKKGDELEVMAKPIPPIPVPPFTGSKPRRGEGESQESYDLRMQEYQKALNDQAKKERKYQDAMEQYNEDKEKYDKYVKDGVHYNQNPDLYDRQHQLFNIFSKAEGTTNVISYGSKAIGDVANVAASASEISYYNGNIGRLQGQAKAILSSLALEGVAQGRKNNILRALEGSKPNAFKYVDASHETKKKLDIPTALDEMQVNTGYELSPRQNQQLALAAAATRACSGIKYKKDLSKLNLIGGGVSATANAISAVGNAFTLLNNPALSAAFQIAGATLGIVSEMFNVHAKETMKRKKQIRNKQLGSNISSMMKVLFNTKDPDGNLPSLADLDSLFLEDGAYHYNRETATISKIDQAENSVAAYDLLTGAGVDIDGMMVAAIRGSEVKNKKDDALVTENNALDLLDLNEKDDKDVEFYQKVFLNKVANI